MDPAGLTRSRYPKDAYGWKMDGETERRRKREKEREMEEKYDGGDSSFACSALRPYLK